MRAFDLFIEISDIKTVFESSCSESVMLSKDQKLLTVCKCNETFFIYLSYQIMAVLKICLFYEAGSLKILSDSISEIVMSRGGEINFVASIEVIIDYKFFISSFDV